MTDPERDHDLEESGADESPDVERCPEDPTDTRWEAPVVPSYADPRLERFADEGDEKGAVPAATPPTTSRVVLWAFVALFVSLAVGVAAGALLTRDATPLGGNRGTPPNKAVPTPAVTVVDLPPSLLTVDLTPRARRPDPDQTAPPDQGEEALPVPPAPADFQQPGPAKQAERQGPPPPGVGLGRRPQPEPVPTKRVATRESVQGSPGRIVLTVPEHASVWIDGQRLEQEGAQREFLTPSIPYATCEIFDVRVLWDDQNGKERSVDKEVVVHPDRSSSLTVLGRSRAK